MNIENKKQIATILLAVGLGLVATFLTGQYIQNNIAQQTKVLAKEYTQQSASLQKELELTKKDIGALGQKYEALVKQVQSQPKVVVAEGAAKAQPPVDQNVFSVVMPPGKRALTIRVDTLSAVGGLINPGDFVDIIATLKVPEDKKIVEQGKTKDVVTVLFQDLQVLAIGTLFKPVGGADLYENRQKAGALNVTLAVTPEEAGLLTFAGANGKLQLSLRSPAEQERQLLQVASWEALSNYVLDKQGTELLAPQSPEKPSLEEPAEGQTTEEEPSGPPIQIFRGGKEL
ncbi:MAG: Flp pilus assembly protein CpaB [Candidatus Omnitrophica bacterium]|nr:Flp pilus assembly protein CpaB [Candidatus Omnitrophota bacterium]